LPRWAKLDAGALASSFFPVFRYQFMKP